MSVLILTDFSTPALAHTVKTNLQDFFRYIARATQTESFGNPELTRWHTRVPLPWFNFGFGLLPDRRIS